MDSRKWGKNSEFTKLFNDIKKAREELITQNLPLAISKARSFWSWTPESHLTYMDLVDIAAEGLILAVDKYVLPPAGFSKVFRSVIIGRATSGFIEEYSNTIIHFYPSDKNKIYKANKLLKTNQDKDSVDYEKLAEELNKTDSDTNPEDIRGLLTPALTVSADAPIKALSQGNDGNLAKTLANFIGIEAKLQPDHISEANDLTAKLSHAILALTLFEKKFLLLKGVIDEDGYRQSIKSS